MNSLPKHTTFALILGSVIITFAAVAAIAMSFLWYERTAPAGQSVTEGDAPQAAPLVTEKQEFDYYTFDLQYPDPAKSDLPQIQELVRTEKENFLKDYGALTQEDIKFLELGGDRVYNLDIKTKIATTSRTISYVVSVYTFTGGAHGGTTVHAFTYKDGKLLSLSDVIPNVDYRALSERARAYFYKKLPDVTRSDIEAGTEARAENFGTWYLSGDSIVFVFGQYSIGPYAIGIQELPIPLVELGSKVI